MEGGASLKQGLAEEGPRVAWVTSGAELARLLEGAMACSFSQEVPERTEEVEAVDRFLRDCAEYSDVRGLPEALVEEMEAHFGQHLETLWALGWLVFGGVRETTLVPGEAPVRGRAVTLCLARHDSPSVRLDARLRGYMERFKVAVERLRGEEEEEERGPLLH